MNRKYILVSLVFVCVVVRLNYAYERASIPFQIDYEEGNVLNAAQRLIHGDTPYPDPASFPYTVSPYGPVGYLLTAFGIKLSGLSLFGPRFLVLVAGIGILFLIAALTKRLGGQWQIGLLLGATYLCLPVVWDWYPLLRVDLWAILLSLMGLYVYSVSSRAWSFAAIVCALGLLTKHTAIAAPVACMAELAAQQRFKRALAFGTITLSAMLVCILPVNGNIGFHLLKTHPDPFSFRAAMRQYLWGIEGCVLIVAVILYSSTVGFISWHKRPRLAWLYLGLCSATALTTGKLGSNSNHMLEWAGAVCLMGGLSLSYLVENKTRFAQPLLAGVFLFTAVFAVLPQFRIVNQRNQSGCADAYAFLRAFPGNRVLSEDVTALILSGKPVLVSNPFVVTQLRNSVDWKQGSIEQLVDKGYFDLIILGGDLRNYQPESGRWSPELITAVGQRYRSAAHFACSPSYNVAYIPK
jgi:hypothetical protein